MNDETYIPEALEIVSAWEVLPQDFSQVVRDQAKIMASTDMDLLADTHLENPYLPLHF